jgi:hypothetical protein
MLQNPAEFTAVVEQFVSRHNRGRQRDRRSDRAARPAFGWQRG